MMRFMMLILAAALLTGCSRHQVIQPAVASERLAKQPVTASAAAVKRSIKLPCTYWYHGFLWNAEAALIGKVRSVTTRKSHEGFSEKWSDYVLDVVNIAGDCPELKGVTEVHAETLGRVEAGSYVVVYVHYYENKPSLATMGHDPIVVKSPQSPFPRLLMRKGMEWERYSSADLQILRRADAVAYQKALDYRKLEKVDSIE